MESPTMRRSEDEKKSSKFDTRIEMSEEGKEDMSSSLSNHAKISMEQVKGTLIPMMHKTCESLHNTNEVGYVGYHNL